METKTFDSLELSPEILHAVADLGYTEMTEIQAGAIPLMMAGADVIGRSSTGTGKTAAFGIPAVESIEPGCDEVRVLVLSPTRELAMQISEEMEKYARYMPHIHLATIYGGQAMVIQNRQLRHANIVIGTPGRIMDHMRRGSLRLNKLNFLVLDEADEMLNMGFYEDIQAILTEVPDERQTALFSATMPPAIMKIIEEFLNDPQLVAVDQGKSTIETISQYYYMVPHRQKLDAMNLIMQANAPERSIIFCNTKRMVDELVDYLGEHGFSAIGLHGDMSQSVRTKVMSDFKCGRIAILAATDVAARGIDVEDVEAVFNYDIPLDDEYYVHRIGRTGRAGKQGGSYTLVTAGNQARRLHEMERNLHVHLKELPLPGREDVIKQGREKQLVKIREALAADATAFQPYLDSLTAEGFAAEDIARALLSLYIGTEDKNIPVLQQARNNVRYDRAGKVCLSVNVGRFQKIGPNFIVSAITEKTGLPAQVIGRIDLYKDYSNFEITPEGAKQVLEVMQNTRIKSFYVHFARVAAMDSKPSFASSGPDKKKTGRPIEKDFYPVTKKDRREPYKKNYGSRKKD